MITHRLCFFLLSYTCLGCFAQIDTTIYFDQADMVTTARGAVYYRKISKPDTGKIYLGVEYWNDGHIKMAGHALDLNFLFKIGKFTYYYQNGKKSGEGQYYSNAEQHIFGFKNGKWETWYANGNPKEEWAYKIADDFAYNESFLMSYWDTAGVKLTTEGEGIYAYQQRVNTKDSAQTITFKGPVDKGRYHGRWFGYYKNGKVYSEEIYAAGIFLNGKSFDGAGNKYTYDSIETYPVFPGGEVEMNRFIKLNIQPTAANDEQAAQPVLVHVFVGRNGFVGHASVIRGASKYMNAEATRVVKLLPRFIPATMRGQPVDSYYNVTVDFMDK